ncbi:MAG: AbrB/MazE/SpoVT family DNA-binding domain-containing protein [Propionibacteriaceae bacterium]|jgi:antitoxin VapB|nr:AbrB/MazE/SpoVT family DNA-binding domain-containing protein [Propionibacteriaceae bacterium]
MEEATMVLKAAVFKNGGSQAVRIPAAFRFDTDSVYIRRDDNGDVVLSERPDAWDGFVSAVTGLDVPADFLDLEGRKGPERDLFEGV